MTMRRSRAVGGWRLAIGGWPLAVSYWRLAIGFAELWLMSDKSQLLGEDKPSFVASNAIIPRCRRLAISG